MKAFVSTLLSTAAVIALLLAAPGCGGGNGQDDLAGTDLAGGDLAVDAVADVPDAQDPADVSGRDANEPYDEGPPVDLCGPDDGLDYGYLDQCGPDDADEPEDSQDDAAASDVVDVIDPSDTTEPEDIEPPSPHGRILLAVMKWGNGDYGTTVQADIGFYDAPMRMDAFAAYSPAMYKAVMRDGACVMYSATDAACEPACDWDQYCDPDSKCVDAPEKISAGTVLLLLGATSHEVEPTGDPIKNYYYVEGIAADLIHGGNSLIAQAEGVAGGFGAFELQTTGIDQVEFSVDADQGTLTLVDDKDNVVTWDVPKGDTTGLFVDMVINKGWHGAPPEVVLYCREPASKGSLTITKEMVFALPTIGGVGLFQHMSHISMNRTVSADVDGKTVHFTVARRHGLNPLHNVEGW